MNVGDESPLTPSEEAAYALYARVKGTRFEEAALREINGWGSGYFKPEDYVPRMSQTTEAKAAAETVIAPEVVARIEPILATYNELLLQRDLLDAQMDAEKQTIRDVLEEHGMARCKIAGQPIYIDRGTSTKIDWSRMLEIHGVTKAMKEDCTIRKPKKSSLVIRQAGEKDTDGQDD